MTFSIKCSKGHTIYLTQSYMRYNPDSIGFHQNYILIDGEAVCKWCINDLITEHLLVLGRINLQVPPNAKIENDEDITIDISDWSFEVVTDLKILETKEIYSFGGV